MKKHIYADLSTNDARFLSRDSAKYQTIAGISALAFSPLETKCIDFICSPGEIKHTTLSFDLRFVAEDESLGDVHWGIRLTNSDESQVYMHEVVGKASGPILSSLELLAPSWIIDSPSFTFGIYRTAPHVNDTLAAFALLISVRVCGVEQ